MKILHISTNDIAGGAARSAYRLHQGLRGINLNSQMLVQSKLSDDKSILAPQKQSEKILAKLGHSLDIIPLYFQNPRPHEFSTQWAPDLMMQKISQINPDVINLHWINESHLKIETIAKLTKPIIWTLHDMWSFTGGCHYDQNCGAYVNSCGNCPQLNSGKDSDLSRWIWKRKYKAWKEIPLTIVTPSIWLAKCAASSSLFKNKRIEVIPYGLDTKKYKPLNRQIIRDLLNLPQDKFLILFVAVNATSAQRKGFHFLQAALQNLSQNGWKEKIELVVIGASQANNSHNLGFTTHFLGKLSDDISLGQIYAATDAFVAPSTQDNLPNTVLEAMSCGTPSIAFNIGGMADMIEHQQNGYLAQSENVEDLAKGIAWILDSKERHQKLSFRAREKIEQEFNEELQARRYELLYARILDNKNQKFSDFKIPNLMSNQIYY